MTRDNSSESIGQPTLTDLMVRFLATRSDAATMAAVEPASGDVEPHEVAAGFRVDPRTAWTDAIAATHAAAPIPSEWSSFVNQPSAAFAVAMAAGNFPQRVKDLHPLLKKFDAKELRPKTGQVAVSGLSGLSGLWAWVESESTSAPLLAAGVARSLGDFERAEQILSTAKSEPKAAHDNELAALLWHRGQCEKALSAWSAMADSPTVHFNRGMALLFTGRTVEARTQLSAAIAGLPEASGWNALARLYLAVAEIQG